MKCWNKQKIETRIDHTHGGDCYVHTMTSIQHQQLANVWKSGTVSTRKKWNKKMYKKDGFLFLCQNVPDFFLLSL